MTRKIFYEKMTDAKGRVRYQPVNEYDSELTYSLPYGTHLINVNYGYQSTKHYVEPAMAPVIAAAMISKRVLLDTLVDYKSNKLTPEPYSPRQIELWEELKESIGVDHLRILSTSWNDQAEQLVEKLVEVSGILLSNPAVKKAYDHFLMIATLSKDYNENIN